MGLLDNITQGVFNEVPQNTDANFVGANPTVSTDAVDREAFSERTPIFGARPDYKSLRTTFVTHTIIAESLNGREFRTTRTPRPRVEMEFKAINMNDRESGRARRLLEIRDERPVGVPVWLDSIYIPGAIINSPSTISVNSSGATNLKHRLFHWFRYALLWQNPATYEVVVISAVTENTITFDPDWLPAQNYAAGSYIVPLAFGYVEVDDSAFHSADVSEINIRFKEQFGVESFDKNGLGSGGFATQTDFLNLSANRVAPSSMSDLLIQPDWRNKPEQGEVDDLFYEPLNVGSPNPYLAYEKSRRTLSFSYTLRRDNLQRFIDFFQNVGGCRGSFYIPTWSHDFNVESSTAVGAFTLQDSGLFQMPANYKEFYGRRDGQLIRLTGGSETTENNFSGYTATPNVGGAWSMGTPFCGAMKVRFSDDKLMVKYEGPECYTLNTEFIEADSVFVEGQNHQQERVEDVQNQTAYLYKFTHGSDICCWTDWGYAVQTAPLSGDSGAGEKGYSLWRSGDVTHDSVEHTNEMLGEDNNVSVNGSLRSWLMQFVTDPELIKIEILSLDMSDYITDTVTSNIPVPVFSGVVMGIQNNSNGETSISISSNLRVLERSMPRIKQQRQCNFMLYDVHCDPDQKLKNLVKLTGELSEYTTGGVKRYRLSNIEKNGQPFTRIWNNNEKPDKWYNGATVIVNGAKYIVLNEYAPDNGDMIIALDPEPLDIPAYGNQQTQYPSADLIPWCDKNIKTCNLFFENAQNFCGCPYLPDNNPAEVTNTADSNIGKK